MLRASVAYRLEKSQVILRFVVSLCGREYRLSRKNIILKLISCCYSGVRSTSTKVLVLLPLMGRVLKIRCWHLNNIHRHLELVKQLIEFKS